ncbi:MAG: helix-turn-helix domain-containing protein [Acidimicrobiia bacterium]
MDRLTLNPQEVAAALGVSDDSVYRAVQETGEVIPGVPALRVGKRLVFSKAQLLRALGVDR